MFVITGGGSGIGAALAQSLAHQKYRVLIVGRRKEALEKTAQFSSLISIDCADVSTVKGREHLLTTLFSIKSIRGLVHNAGIIDPMVGLSQIEEASWRHILETNLTAPFLLSQTLLPQLQGGRVLHISSGAAHFPVKSWGGYCVSKAGLSMLTRCWQIEETKVAFASVKPGIIDTDMQAMIRRSTTMDPKKLEFFHKLKQENRLLSPCTVANFLTWLLLETSPEKYSSQEWDIYDKTHHPFWLSAPNTVPSLD